MSDYISREAAESALKQPVTMSMCLTLEECKQKNAQRQIDLFVIRGLPAADVRPEVKSKWADNCVSFYRGCPECGAFVRANLNEVFLRDFPSAVGKLNFCPNCGCAMEES